MRVTEKGQVTIPQEVRIQLGIEPGTEVEFVAAGDHAILRKIARPEEVAERFAAYKGRADRGMSTETILKLTRE
ncbi:MAG: AbrB/MazE/SpoVT family DNA-binding domain-containing protein [Spirochaetales bacterium]|nr:AbrB/MazE/SpoVT family DNA-binding domain-containing protein [Spirochaetales bacterium]